jgi:chemosensory pili system protein ChpC
MSAVVESVRSLWVPLSGINLLVPNVAIAEVINYQPLDLIEQGPDWLVAKLHWRDREVPVVSIERMVGRTGAEGGLGARISVVNSVKKNSKVPFFAMLTSGIPRLFNAEADTLGDSVLVDKEFTEVVADAVQIGSEQALIPNLEIIQGMIEVEWAKYR